MTPEQDRFSVALTLGRYRLRLDLILLLALLLGSLVRVNGLDWGWTDFSPLPAAQAPAMSFYNFHPDEASNVLVARNFTESDSWRPTGELYGQKLDYSLYGATTVYLHVMAVKLASVVGGFTPFDFEDPRSFRDTYLAIRWLTQLMGLASILLLYIAAHHLYGRRTARWAALFLALTAFHAQSGRFGTVDVPMVFFMVWSLAHSARLLRFGQRRDLWLGALAAGLALSTKVNAILVVVPLTVAELEWQFARQADARMALGARLKFLLGHLFGWRLWSAAAVTVGVFFVLNPYAFLDYHNYLFGDHAFALFHIIRNVRGEFFYPFQIQFEHIHPFVYLFSNVLLWSAGLALELAGLAGLVFMGLTRRPADRVLLAWFLVSVALTGNAQVMFMRYALPFLPLIALAAARLVQGLREEYKGGWTRPASWALGLLVLLPSLQWSMALASVHSVEDSRISAGRHLKQVLPSGAVVLHERSANSIKPVIHRPSYTNVCLEIPALQRAVESNTASAGQQVDALRARLDGVEWAALLESNRKLGFDRNGGYPVIRAFYAELFDGRLGFQTDSVFQVLPRALGITIDDEPAEFSLRYYDHEEIHIFRRRSAQAVDSAFVALRARLEDGQDRTAALARQALAEGRLEDARSFAEQGLNNGTAGASMFYEVLARVFEQAALLGSGTEELDLAARYYQKAIQTDALFREDRLADYGEFLLALGQREALGQLLKQVASQGISAPRLDQLARRLRDGSPTP